MDTNDRSLRQQLVNLLLVQQAHMGFEEAVADFPPQHINDIPNGLDYSFWQLLEHMRICQWDILDYIRNPNYTPLPFPQGYWPPAGEQVELTGWQRTIEEFLYDRQGLINIINDPSTDLHQQIPHAAAGHTILREVLIITDHNAYHIGEFAILRQSHNLWPLEHQT